MRHTGSPTRYTSTLAAASAQLYHQNTWRPVEEVKSAPVVVAGEALAPGAADVLTAGLTEREREVLVLAGRGLSNDEIAAAIFVSRATVKTHVNRVFAKLGISSRVQAVVLCYEHGLVVPGRGGPP